MIKEKTLDESIQFTFDLDKTYSLDRDSDDFADIVDFVYYERAESEYTYEDITVEVSYLVSRGFYAYPNGDPGEPDEYDSREIEVDYDLDSTEIWENYPDEIEDQISTILDKHFGDRKTATGAEIAEVDFSELDDYIKDLGEETAQERAQKKADDGYYDEDDDYEPDYDYYDESLEEELSPEDKVRLWNDGSRIVNIRACSDNKLNNYRRIALRNNYINIVRQIDSEISRRNPGERRAVQSPAPTPSIPSIFSFKNESIEKEFDLLTEFEEQFTDGKLTQDEYKSLLTTLKEELETEGVVNESELIETYSDEELDAMINKTYNQQKILNIYRRTKYNDKRLFAHTRCIDCGREKRVFLSNLINDPEKYGSCICSDTNVEARLDNINDLYSGRKKLSNNTSGYTGVSYVKNYSGEIYDKWRAYIDIDGHRHFLGDFDSKADAVRARKEAAEKGIKWYKDHKNEFMRDTRKKQKRHRNKSYKSKNKAKGTKV